MNLTRLITLGALCVVVSSLTADDKKPDMQAAMQAMTKHATPGDAHKVLEKFVGKGPYTGKWGMPGGPSVEMHGNAETKLMMGGRFLAETVKGDDPQMPFEGEARWGYDNHTKKYWATWLDSMTTSLSQMEGTWDAAKKTMTWTGDMYEAGENKNMKMKQVDTVKPDGTIYKVFYRVEDGKETKVMEITYSRTK